MEKKNLKILLVDDDEDDRLFFADALQGLQMDTELLEFKNGKDCVEHLTQSSDDLPNLIFLDLNMPVMNGFECLEIIRKDVRFSEIMIAIYSTSSSEHDIEATFSKGANIYIKKPSSFKDLKGSLKQVIKMNWAYHMNDFNRENFMLKV